MSPLVSSKSKTMETERRLARAGGRSRDWPPLAGRELWHHGNVQKLHSGAGGTAAYIYWRSWHCILRMGTIFGREIRPRLSYLGNPQRGNIFRVSVWYPVPLEYKFLPLMSPQGWCKYWIWRRWDVVWASAKKPNPVSVADCWDAGHTPCVLGSDAP